jgi:hypothetical protein
MQNLGSLKSASVSLHTAWILQTDVTFSLTAWMAIHLQSNISCETQCTLCTERCKSLAFNSPQSLHCVATLQLMAFKTSINFVTVSYQRLKHQPTGISSRITTTSLILFKWYRHSTSKHGGIVITRPWQLQWNSLK